jgi:CRP-like cAMP-binding protein
MKPAEHIQQGKLCHAIMDFLIHIPLFDGLRGLELSILARHMNVINIEKGGILFREGDRGDFICFVLDGIIDVIKESAQGGRVVIASLKKGRSIGEMSVIDDSPRSATARARSKASLLTLTKKSFDRILAEHPKIGIKVLKGLARLLSLNLRKTSGQLADYICP